MEPVSTTIAVASVIFKGLGWLFKSRANDQKRQAAIIADYNKADVYDLQADIALENASYALKNIDQLVEKSKEDLSDLYSYGEQVRGSQEAVIASSGFVVGTGSMADITEQTMLDVQKDANILLKNVNYASDAYRFEANQYKRQAGIYKEEASNLREYAGTGYKGEQIATALAGIGDIVGTIGNYANKGVKVNG